MNKAVFEIQSYLRNISRVDRDIPSLIPDGIFGDETTQSVLAFQRKSLLPQTGKVDYETWSRLSEENERALFILSEPVQTAPVTRDDLPLKRGKESHLNSNVNLMLLRLSDFYGNFSSASLSSDYTEETENLISTFQSLAGLPVTGEADKETWNLLSTLYLLLTEKEKG